MDVFYYWKCYEVDIEEKWLGRFVVDTKKMSTKKKLDEIKKAEPQFIWVFKTPRGCGVSKNSSVREEPLLQLLARLAWSKEEISGFPKSGRTGECLHYDPKHPDSIVYTDTSNLMAIESVTKVLKDRGMQGFNNRFQGGSGVQRLEGKLLADMKVEVAKYSHQPF
jgi:hypothetical protein